MHANNRSTAILPRTMLALAAVTTLLGGCVVPPQRHPHPQDPTVIYVPPPQPVYEDIRRCDADNQRAHAEILDNYERARAAGRIDPAEAQQFGAIDARLRNLRAQLSRDGLTMQECQYIGGELARARDDVAAMSRSDPAAVRCMAETRWAQQDVRDMYENARRAGNINPSEAKQFSAMDARLNNLRGELARDGISLQDCQRIAGAVARERDEVIRMSRHEPNAARCMSDNRRAHWAVYDTYNQGVRARRIDANEAQQFRQMDDRLKRYQTAIRQDGVRMDECQRLARAIAQERALVDRMVQY